MNYNKIDSLRNKLGLSRAAIARIVGMTNQGFISMMEKKTMNVAVLEKLATYYKKPISYFFDDEELNQVSEPQAGYSNLKEKYVEVLEKNVKLSEELWWYNKNCSCKK